MSVPRIFRVIVPVSDIERAASFYAEVFGIPGERVSSDRHYFDCGGVIFACFDSQSDGHSEAVGPNPEHIYLAVNDLDTFAERARQLDFARVSDIRQQPWGERSIYTTDPFGNRVCFVDSATLFTGGEHFD